jgi:hypothetical protein
MEGAAAVKTLIPVAFVAGSVAFASYGHTGLAVASLVIAALVGLVALSK